MSDSKEGLTPLWYQADYLEQLWNAYKYDSRDCSLNGSETGTGKTMMYVQAASKVAMDIHQRTKKQPTIWLFTVRQDKKQQIGEIVDWDLRTISGKPNDVYLIDGNDADRTTQLELVQWIHPKWVILNYEQGKLHLAQIMKLFQRGVDILVCNEGDLAQNINSERSIVTRAIASVAAYRIVATATPIPNRIDSLYPLLQIMQPQAIETRTMLIGGVTTTFPCPTEAAGIGKRSDFLREFAFMDNERVVGVRNVPKLRRLLEEQYGLFIATKEMAGIERSDNRPLFVELGEESRAMYDGIKRGIFEYVDQLESAWEYMSESDKTEEIRHILVQLNLARRATSLSSSHYSRLRLQKKLIAVNESLGEHFALPPVEPRMLSKGNAKVDAAVKLIKEFVDSGEDGGVYVHSEWTDVLDEIEYVLKQNGIGQKLGLQRIDGEQGNTENVRLAVKYGTCRLVLASNAGGRGLNLQNLSMCIFLVPPWSPWILSQGAGRIERIGQKNKTVCYYILAADTIDTKKMWSTVTSKEKDNQAVLHGERGKRYKSILDISTPSDIKNWL